MSEAAANLQEWHGPGAPIRKHRVFSWRALVWSLVFPPKRHRIGVTVPGIFLFCLAMGIGTAAYNAASNILFLTLSLLLACLLLSGLLSWFNFMGVCWRVRLGGAWRAGHDTIVTVEMRNTKSWLPTYGLWLDLATHPVAKPNEPTPDLAKKKVREVLAAAEKAVTRGRVLMRERIEPQGETTLEWVHRPATRGKHQLALEAVGSVFPFGFLRKSVGTGQSETVLVWPAQVDYQWLGATTEATGNAGQRSSRLGTGEDLLALRRYASGDSHRLVHWKASARLGKLMVRQFAAESLDGFSLNVETPAEQWIRPEQFERLCSFAATLAEDLFAEGRLRGVWVNAQWIETRRLRDVEAVLDLLAVVEPVARSTSAGGPANQRNLITFAPEGAHGVTAYVDGVRTATA